MSEIRGDIAFYALLIIANVYSAADSHWLAIMWVVAAGLCFLGNRLAAASTAVKP